MRQKSSPARQPRSVSQLLTADSLEHCGFDHRKANAARSAPLGGIFWDGGAETFIHKGTNGRWRDVLSEDEVRKYEDEAYRQLGPACAHWLATGER